MKDSCMNYEKQFRECRYENNFLKYSQFRIKLLLQMYPL